MRTSIIVLAAIATLLLNGFFGACLMDGISPARALSLVAEPAALAVFLAGGLGSYAIFAAITSLFTFTRKTFRHAPNAWPLFFAISTGLHLGVMFLAQSPSHASDTQSPSHSAVPSMTESQLRAFADAQNATLPLRTSPNLELTRIEAGPGLRATYRIRILATHVTAETFSQEAIAEIRASATTETCSNMAAGLRAGVTYTMSYAAHDGTELFAFPIAASDCP